MTARNTGLALLAIILTAVLASQLPLPAFLADFVQTVALVAVAILGTLMVALSLR